MENIQKHKSKLKARINQLFDDEEKFFDTIKKEKETFWKNFDEGKVEIPLIQRISEILELSNNERNEIFFDGTIGKAQAIQFYNLMLQIIKKLPEEERLVFLQTFDEKFKKLKRK